jgi:cellulose synthase operon protein YhjU
MTPSETIAATAAVKPAMERGRPAIALGNWSLYFLAKLALCWRELIGFHPIENLALAAFLLVPITSRTARLVRTALAIPVAIALLYYDSWLPPIGRVVSQASLVSNFSLTYLGELAGRFIDWPVVAMLTFGWSVYYIVARYVRVGVIVVIALIAVAAGDGREHAASLPAASVLAASVPAAASASLDPDAALREFYDKESRRVVKFPNAGNAVPFDIVFIHICSLSWDDLQATGVDKHPLWKDLDFLFTHFNSAASYSGPAAIRINRATCGQTSHSALYKPVSDDCYLMPSLKQAGFETNLAFNHDGHFDDFLTLVRKQGVNAPLQSFDGITVPVRAFDNSPVYDDFGVLSRWLDTRQKAPDPHAVLFYNTISLHDGNRIVSGPDAKLSSKDNYRSRVEKLLNDLTAFMDQIRKRGRRAVVVIIPEHGAALRGDKFQIAGLREIPTPAITLVPVGVKIVGSDATRSGGAVQIGEPSSYVGLSQLVARLIEKPPFGTSGFDAAQYAAELPTTEHVAENEGVVVMRQGSRYFLKQGTEAWGEYVPSTPGSAGL